MSNKNTRNPQMPGAATAQEVDTSADTQTSDETVAVPRAQLDALLARIAVLEEKPAAKRANPDAQLSDQDSIDLTTLKVPVLTKQGWLVPQDFGSHKNAPK